MDQIQPKVTILNMGAEELAKLFAEQNEKHTEKIAKLIASVEDIGKQVSEHLVDRYYLERNFGWKRRRIETFEREGLLRPEGGVEADNGKTKFYKLGKCIELFKSLQNVRS